MGSTTWNGVKWTVAVGNSFDGVSLNGTFDSRSEAEEWAKKQQPLQRLDWQTVAIAPIKEATE